MSDWTKVEKEKENFTKVEKEKEDWTKGEKGKEDWDLEDRTDFGWFASGWFYDWFRGIIWEIINKAKENWNKVNKE